MVFHGCDHIIDQAYCCLLQCPVITGEKSTDSFLLLITVISI